MRQLSLRWQVDVHPGRSLEVEEAVRDELNGRLMRCGTVHTVFPAHRRRAKRASDHKQCLTVRAHFSPRHDERLGGVMLSYWDERIVSRKAR